MKKSRELCFSLITIGAAVTLLASALEAGSQSLSPVTARPLAGTFYSMQRTNLPPLPFLPFPELELFSLGNDCYAYNDLTLDYPALDAVLRESRAAARSLSVSSLESGVPTPPGDGPWYELDPDPPPAYRSYTNGELWIEITGITNDYAYLTLHGTKPNLYYAHLSRTNVAGTTWTQGRDVYNLNGPTNVVFDPVRLNNQPINFFRGQQADAAVYVYGSVATEPDPGSGKGGQAGVFSFNRQGNLSPALTVYFTIGGTATMGVDYSNILSSVTFQPGAYGATVNVVPLPDFAIEGDETVTVTLVPTNGYVVSHIAPANSIVLKDTIFFTVANLPHPVGLDYHPPTQSLLSSYNYSSGQPYNFARIGNNGTNAFLANWSRISGLPDEIKLATAKANANGFANGETFFGNGYPGGIGWLSADGSVSNLNWVILSNEVSNLRGGLYIDQSGSFGGDLIVTSGDSYPTFEIKHVWRINANRQATLIGSLTNASHLEGVVTLTNDVQKWGPWAGKVITGDENMSTIYAVATNGSVSSFDLGINPEDFDIIPPNQDLYCADQSNGRIVKLASDFLTNHVGDLLITDAGEATLPHVGKLFLVHWNDIATNFNVTLISYPNGELEHVTFAPKNLLP